MKNYQRKFLRAPYKFPVLLTDGEIVFKAETLNLSEGGILLKNISYIPKSNEIWVTISIPTFPNFKNYDIEQFRNFNWDNFPKTVIKAKARIVRRVESDDNLSDLFEIRGGVEFIQISSQDQKMINQYVSSCSSNLVLLQTLIDTIDSDKYGLEKTRLLSDYLGYTKDVKISLLRKNVQIDYKSLQWI